MSTLASEQQRFRAMGSDIHLVIVDGTPDLFDLARQRIEELEQRWSRFRDDSEISRLNAAAGTPVQISDDTVLLLRHAIEAWRITGGSFDPTLLHALRAAGYDRSFELLADGDVTLPRLDVMRPGCTDIEIDGNTVTFPEGLGFDAGGIGKGLAADLVSLDLIEAGAAGVCVNMGGDLRVRGDSPEGNGWTLSIDHPWCTQPVVLVGLWEGGLATSSVLKRAWTSGGLQQHHLIDPHTAQPMTTDLGLASVIAADAWKAEVFTKAVMLRGAERAFDLIDDTTAALAVDINGNVVASANFAAFVGNLGVPTQAVFDTTWTNQTNPG